MTLHLTFNLYTLGWFVSFLLCLVIWFVVESANSPGSIMFGRKDFKVTRMHRFTAKFFLAAALGSLAASFWTIGTIL